MTDERNEQQIYFDKLCSVVHPTTLKVANNNFDSKIAKYIPGRRYKADKYKIHDERMVAINEIIFELDWKAYKRNYQEAMKIIEVLDNYQIEPLICASGGKGIHIHIFFNKLNFESSKHKKIFKEALSYGFSYRSIRLWFLKKICSEAGIDEKHVGPGKQVDTQPISFNYFAGTTHLIRDVGGKKYVKNVEGEWDAYYKTYIPTKDFNHKKPKVTELKNVTFPESIPLFDIDTVDLCEYLANYIKFQQNQNIEQSANIKFDGTYTDIDGVLRIREGMAEGKRSSGASVIAVACRIDDIPKKKAMEIMKEYVANCSQIGTTFTLAEAENWLNWIYAHDKPFWNCSLLEDLEIHEQGTCQYCQSKNKDAIKLLQKTDLLSQIKEVLDDVIVGEDETKMLIFLLCLSKDFPSRTGRPAWNILSDPASQNVIVSSDSSSGKSWVIKAVLDLFGEPEKDYFVISRITKNALNYYTDINMDGKIIFIEEVQGLDENTSQLRVWMSEGNLNLSTVEKVKNDEGLEVNVNVTKTTKGQPVFVTNQAEGKIETQLNNRSWLLSTDVGSKQTEDILKFQDDIFRGSHGSLELKKRKIVDALHQLKPFHFKVPFANHKAMGIPINDVRSRRDYKKFITLIQCSAYLHQKMRDVEVDDEGREFLICDIQDYEVARQYSNNILGATFSGLTNAQIDIISAIKSSSWHEEFTINTLMRNYGKSRSHWYGLIGQLVDIGFVFETDKGGRGTPTMYSLNMDKALNIILLPSGEELLKNMHQKGDYKNDKNRSITDEEQKNTPVYSNRCKFVSQITKTQENLSGPLNKFFPEIDDPCTNSSEPKTASPANSEGTAMPSKPDSGTKLFLKKKYTQGKKSFPEKTKKNRRDLGKFSNNSGPIDSSASVRSSDSIISEEQKTEKSLKQSMLQHIRSQKTRMCDSVSIIQHLKIDSDAAYELISKSLSEGDIFETRADVYVVLE